MLISDGSARGAEGGGRDRPDLPNWQPDLFGYVPVFYVPPGTRQWEPGPTSIPVPHTTIRRDNFHWTSQAGRERNRTGRRLRRVPTNPRHHPGAHLAGRLRRERGHQHHHHRPGSTPRYLPLRIGT
jgi:hypothetical protein